MTTLFSFQQPAAQLWKVCSHVAETRRARDMAVTRKRVANLEIDILKFVVVVYGVSGFKFEIVRTRMEPPGPVTLEALSHGMYQVQTSTATLHNREWIVNRGAALRSWLS